MANRLFNKLFMVFGLLFISNPLHAATATATISANVVPRATLLMTGSILLGSEASTVDDSQTKVNVIQVKTTSFNSTSKAKIIVNTSHNAAYDISISPSSTLSSSTEKILKIKTLRTNNSFESDNNDKEQNLVIEAEVSNTGTQGAELYIGTVEINVNYN